MPRKLNPAWLKWRDDCETIEALIKRIQEAKQPHGEKWARKTAAHHQERLAVVKANEPPRYLDEGGSPIPDEPRTKPRTTPAKRK